MYRVVIEPSNDELRAELLRQSHEIFDCIGLGGVLGPNKFKYDQLRLPCMPAYKYLLAMYALPRTTAGWSWLLIQFDLTPPTLSESKEAWLRKEEILLCRMISTQYKR